MPDLCMCRNKECPLNKKCYRYTAKSDLAQSYADFKPDEKGKCEYFMDNKGRKNGSTAHLP